MIHRLASASYHQWLYDSQSLTRLLAEGGFSETMVCSSLISSSIDRRV